MLLIVTERGDLTADWLVRELENRSALFVRFNTEDYPTRVGLEWSPGAARLRLPEREVLLSDVNAVWYRRPAAPRISEGLAPAEAAWAQREAAVALMGVWRTVDALWVNHPDRNRLAESKPEQLRTAEALGFEVPATVVTNEPETLRGFVSAHPDGVICKPLWDGRVPAQGGEHLFFTTQLDPSAVPVDELGPEPYLFQERVRKRYDIRVTVIGREALAARIESQLDDETKTDWRGGRPGRLPHAVEELPAEVSERCVSLCEHYGLQFGAIDLARRPDGGYTFFEVNPNGQWAWVEQRTGLPLRARLADLLLAAVPA